MDDDKERRKYIFRAGASQTGERLPALFSNELLSYVKYCIIFHMLLSLYIRNLHKYRKDNTTYTLPLARR